MSTRGKQHYTRPMLKNQGSIEDLTMGSGFWGSHDQISFWFFTFNYGQPPVS